MMIFDQRGNGSARVLGRGRRKRAGVGVRRQRSGIVLILVTVIIVLLSMAGLDFVLTLATEHKAIVLHGDELRLQQTLESGVELMATFAEQSPSMQQSAGGAYDNPDVFRGGQVFSDDVAARQGRVTLVSPRWDNDEMIGVRYGWENESGRLNLAVLPEWERQVPDAGKRALMCLPGMTESAAAKILDWVDADDVARPGGAERQQYSDLRLPYAPRNGCPARIEELLLIRDVSRNLLLGRDVSFDYRLSARETGGRTERMGSGATGSPPPWASLLTLYSAESNMNPRCQARVELNDPNLPQLYNRLRGVVDPKWSEFIILYRQFGPATPIAPPGAAAGSPGATAGSPSSARGPATGLPNSAAGATAGLPRSAAGPAAASPSSAGSVGRPANRGARPSSLGGPPAGLPPPPGSPLLDFSRPGRFRIESVLDLIGAKVLLPPPIVPQPQAVDSPFLKETTAMREYLPILLDETTVVADTVIRGRVNMNTASRMVLRGVPGMEERIVEAIVSNRRVGGDAPEHRHPTWLLTEGVVGVPQMRVLLQYLTCGGRVYRAQVVAYFEEGGPVARAEVVVDATVTPPRPVGWTDLRVRGRGFSREEL